MENIEKFEKKEEQQKIAETSEKIAEMLKAGVDELIVHGEMTEVGGEKLLAIRPDLDSLSALYLINLAGIDYKKLTVIPKGEWVPGGIHIDVGERPELAIEDDGSVFFDHHGKEKAEPTSATKIVYEVLTQNGLLKKEKWMDRFVEYVTEIDNLSYELDEESLRENWWQNLYGLSKNLSVSQIVEFFREGTTPLHRFIVAQDGERIVKRRDGKEEKLADIARRQKRMVNYSIDGIKKKEKEIEESGINPVNKILGKTLINKVEKPKNEDGTNGKNGQNGKNEIPLGFTAGKAFGLDSYVMFNENKGGFFLTSKNDLMPVYEKIMKVLPKVKIIRGTMVIYNPSDTDEKISFEKLLEVLEFERK